MSKTSRRWNKLDGDESATVNLPVLEQASITFASTCQVDGFGKASTPELMVNSSAVSTVSAVPGPPVRYLPDTRKRSCRQREVFEPTQAGATGKVRKPVPTP